jgi:hypothetical protein
MDNPFRRKPSNSDINYLPGSETELSGSIPNSSEDPIGYARHWLQREAQSQRFNPSAGPVDYSDEAVQDFIDSGFSPDAVKRGSR